ncbi:MAG: hypothetical protein J6Z36_00260 [Clostridia bacterium]|nr:hypothetical protein [Clostridia bacterium]
MKEYEQEAEGVSLGEIFRVLWRRKWIALILFAVITVAVALAIEFGWNRSNAYYYAEFSYEFPGSESGRYPDGLPNRNSDLISYERLAKIKASDSQFASIDIDKMYNDNGISITEYEKTVIQHRDSVTEEETVKTGVIYIETKGKYYSSEKQAKAFIQRLASFPVDYALTVAEDISYDDNLVLYQTSDSYETQLDYLSAQIELIEEGLDSFKEAYGGSYIING